MGKKKVQPLEKTTPCKSDLRFAGANPFHMLLGHHNI